LFNKEELGYPCNVVFAGFLLVIGWGRGDGGAANAEMKSWSYRRQEAVKLR
jgi:hypothetical protein